jgi:hypothetical protein
MRRLIAGIAAALVLGLAVAAPAAAWTVTPSCDHITFGHVPAGASATLTPGPITIAPSSSTTSINGTYEVPPATYRIAFSDGSVLHATVPACPTGSPPPSASPSSSPGSSPSSSPRSSPSPGSSPAPTPSPSPSHGTPAPSPSRSGGILGATATPRRTAPATDAVASLTSDGLSASLPLLVSLLVGINIGLVLILRSLDRPHGRTRRG